jgi:hypothetical protein
MKRGIPITNFFKPKEKCAKIDKNATTSSPSIPSPSTEQSTATITMSAELTTSTSRPTQLAASSSAEQLSVCAEVEGEDIDVALLVKRSAGAISDISKLKVIDQKPPNLDEMPFVVEGKQKRRFNPSWCNEFPWLRYSKSQGGGYCAACALFCINRCAGTGGQVKLGVLVQVPMTKFKKARDTLFHHNSTSYHAEAMTRMEAFVHMMKTGQSIDILLSNRRKKEIEQNRRLLLPVVESILFCGRNMLPLRGHRDDGPIDLDAVSVTGEGLFRALLRYRVQSGDNDLETLLQQSSKNCTMISKTTQNELIDITG